jgi:hypothetical protein
MNIIIPEHAFEWMGIPVSDDLYPGKNITMKLGPMDAKVITLI